MLNSKPYLNGTKGFKHQNNIHYFHLSTPCACGTVQCSLGGKCKINRRWILPLRNQYAHVLNEKPISKNHLYISSVWYGFKSGEALKGYRIQIYNVKKAQKSTFITSKTLYLGQHIDDDKLQEKTSTIIVNSSQTVSLSL